MAARLELNIGVAQIRPHRINGDFAVPMSPNMRSISGNFSSSSFSDFRCKIGGGVQPRAAAADELEQHRALVELRDELRPSRVNTNSDEPNNTTAAATTTSLNRSAHASSGV